MHTTAIANEFDSYLQDRAQRLGYRVRSTAPDCRCAPAAAPRFALVALTDPAQHQARSAAMPPHLLPYREHGHFSAWADAPGALVQVNGHIGARTFAEQFFGDEQGRSLPLQAFRAYAAWLATDCSDPSPLVLAIRQQQARELILVRLPSATAALAWLQRQAWD